MKLLHVSDWHLGRTTYNVSRAEDHEQVLSEIADIARHETPDLIVHTGDLFESIRPAYEDMERGIRVLLDLSAVAPVVVLCGNHDSPALFRLFQKLLGDGSRVRFIDRARAADDGGVLTFPARKGQRIRLGVLPFVHANRMVPGLEKPETWMQSYADRVQLLEQNLADGLTEDANLDTDVLLFAAHLHVAGATWSHSEREIHISETYASRVEHVPKVSYAAFGHIHKPQPLPASEKGWYAGSPIPLDFGEIGEQKRVLLVEADPGRPPEIRELPLSGGRPLRKLEGTLADLAQKAPTVGKALCLVTVNTDSPTADLSERVRDLLPDATILQVIESCSAQRAVALREEDAHAAEPTFEELFREYLGETGVKGATVDRVMSTFSALLAAVEHEEKAAFPEESLLLEESTASGATGTLSFGPSNAVAPLAVSPVNESNASPATAETFALTPTDPPEPKKAKRAPRAPKAPKAPKGEAQ